jgi:hypothetical protein
MAACAFDDPGRDGPARGQGLVVAEVLVLAGQVADARVDAGPRGAGQAGGVGFGGDLGGCAGAVPGQDRKCLDRYPVLGGGVTGPVQAPGRFPDVLDSLN